MGFEHIIGNNEISLLLTNSIASNNILHSYMFVGPNGIGKYLFAKTFANMIFCNIDDLRKKPCLNCNSCTLFKTSNHPDFMVIEPEDGKNIKVEQIRYLQEKIAEKPIVSEKKVYIINDSDCMTKEAQNCLLKTLEEPPSYAIIILILSNESKLLTTIKSRCTKIVFNPISNEDILKYFTINNIKPPTPNILKVCNGSIGRAITLQNESIQYEDINNIINLFDKADIVTIWNSSNILYQSKENINNLLDYFNIIFIDKLKSSHNLKYANCIKLVEETKKNLSSNANFDMSIDNFLLKTWEEFNEKYSWS